MQLRSEALDELEENYGYEDDYEDNDNWDMDGDALASAGYGTDEDYGYYGDEGEW